MKCMEPEKLFAYTHGLLEPRQEGEVRAHVSGCAACRGAVEEYRKLDAVLEEWKPVEPSPWFDARLRAAVERSAAAPAASSLFGFGALRWLTPALAVVLVVTSVVLVRARRTRHGSEARAQVAHQAAATALTVAGTAQPEAEPGEEELRLYRNLPILEDYDMLADFDMLSELPKSEKQVDN